MSDLVDIKNYLRRIGERALERDTIKHRPLICYALHPDVMSEEEYMKLSDHLKDSVSSLVFKSRESDYSPSEEYCTGLLVLLIRLFFENSNGGEFWTLWRIYNNSEKKVLLNWIRNTKWGEDYALPDIESISLSLKEWLKFQCWVLRCGEKEEEEREINENKPNGRAATRLKNNATIFRWCNRPTYTDVLDSERWESLCPSSLDNVDDYVGELLKRHRLEYLLSLSSISASNDEMFPDELDTDEYRWLEKLWGIAPEKESNVKPKWVLYNDNGFVPELYLPDVKEEDEDVSVIIKQDGNEVSFRGNRIRASKLARKGFDLQQGLSIFYNGNKKDIQRLFYGELILFRYKKESEFGRSQLTDENEARSLYIVHQKNKKLNIRFGEYSCSIEKSGDLFDVNVALIRNSSKEWRYTKISLPETDVAVDYLYSDDEQLIKLKRPSNPQVGGDGVMEELSASDGDDVTYIEGDVCVIKAKTAFEIAECDGLKYQPLTWTTDGGVKEWEIVCDSGKDGVVFPLSCKQGKNAKINICFLPRDWRDRCQKIDIGTQVEAARRNKMLYRIDTSNCVVECEEEMPTPLWFWNKIRDLTEWHRECLTNSRGWRLVPLPQKRSILNFCNTTRLCSKDYTRLFEHDLNYVQVILKDAKADGLLRFGDEYQIKDTTDRILFEGRYLDDGFRVDEKLLNLHVPDFEASFVLELTHELYYKDCSPCYKIEKHISPLEIHTSNAISLLDICKEWTEAGYVFLKVNDRKNTSVYKTVFPVGVIPSGGYDSISSRWKLDEKNVIDKYETIRSFFPNRLDMAPYWEKISEQYNEELAKRDDQKEYPYRLRADGTFSSKDKPLKMARIFSYGEYNDKKRKYHLNYIGDVDFINNTIRYWAGEVNEYYSPSRVSTPAPILIKEAKDGQAIGFQLSTKVPEGIDDLVSIIAHWLPEDMKNEHDISDENSKKACQNIAHFYQMDEKKLSNIYKNNVVDRLVPENIIPQILYVIFRSINDSRTANHFLAASILYAYGDLKSQKVPYLDCDLVDVFDDMMEKEASRDCILKFVLLIKYFFLCFSKH